MHTVLSTDNIITHLLFFVNTFFEIFLFFLIAMKLAKNKCYSAEKRKRCYIKVVNKIIIFEGLVVIFVLVW